ncbi:TRAP transporter large permease [Desulfonatronum sp. SC1]|uniref:TRAP transporter large permease n=1 Tax=Desulfonatronum sp. SC1 TaxID=2109626 RepID=UPI000D3022B9|nr:TRAP transporter large permease [Desulfonatronum sp. SC1]PTN35024.1 C4-dicarboxylate ABC transporter permease [Desulfonatronum sp. SC1]
MSPTVIGLAGIGLFFLLLILRMPIAYAMALTGFLGFSWLVSPDAAFRVVSKDLYATFSSYSLSVIPMFIFMGFLAFYSGIGARLFTFAYRTMGHYPGGLAIATQATCALFGAVCGSNTATAATIGAIAIPEMKKYRYADTLSTASVAAGGALGVLFPPSVIFIVYGMATEQSIGKLFMAGIIPGFLLMFLYMATIFIMARRNPRLGPPGPVFGWKDRLAALKGGIWEVFVIFSLSLGGLFAGWFTPTEAGAVGASGVFFLTLIQGKLRWDGLKRALADSTRTTAMIMLLVAGAVIFGRFMAVSRIPFDLASWAGQLDLPAYVVMALILLIYLVLGFFIDALALVLLTIPIFYPVVVNVLGYDPIWFGVIMVLVVAMGVITPPVGMNVYIVKGIAADVPLETIFKGIWPFLAALIVCIAILLAFPALTTFLPGLI